MQPYLTKGGSSNPTNTSKSLGLINISLWYNTLEAFFDKLIIRFSKNKPGQFPVRVYFYSFYFANLKSEFLRIFNCQK